MNKKLILKTATPILAAMILTRRHLDKRNVNFMIKRSVTTADKLIKEINQRYE